MRSFLFSIAFCFLSLFANAFKTVQVLTPQSFLLNSTTKLGGKTRIVLPVSLPLNTLKWYYSVTTSKNTNSNQPINLLSQLLRFEDPTGTLTDVVSSLSVPQGYANCDVFLLAGDNCSNFLDKWTKSFNYSMPYSRMNYVSGVVEVPAIPSGYSACLGFRNNSNLYGVYVTVDIVAIVQE